MVVVKTQEERKKQLEPEGLRMTPAIILRTANRELQMRPMYGALFVVKVLLPPGRTSRHSATGGKFQNDVEIVPGVRTH